MSRTSVKNRGCLSQGSSVPHCLCWPTCVHRAWCAGVDLSWEGSSAPMPTTADFSKFQNNFGAKSGRVSSELWKSGGRGNFYSKVIVKPKRGLSSTAKWKWKGGKKKKEKKCRIATLERQRLSWTSASLQNYMQMTPVFTMVALC